MKRWRGFALVYIDLHSTLPTVFSNEYKPSNSAAGLEDLGRPSLP